MYIDIGGDMAVREQCILGIFDLDNTSWSRHTRDFLKRAEENGAVISVCNDIPKAFVLTEEYNMGRIYLTQFNAATIEKRLQTRNT